MIDTMFQEGTDAALRDQVQRPTMRPKEPPSFSLWAATKAPGQGVGAGAAEGVAFGSEILGAFGSVAGAYPEALGVTELSDQQRQEAEQARRKLLKEGPTYSNEAGDIFRARAKDIMPDPETTHSSAQVIAGVSKFFTKAVGYAATTGPLAPVGLGGDEAFTEADKLKQAGVDLGTRSAAGAVAGVTAGLSIALPVVGATAMKTAGLVVAGGPGGFIAQNAAERAILEHGGYNEIASQYDPFDPVGLALSGLVPAAFGAHGYRARSRGAATPTGPLRTEGDLKAASKLTPEEQAHSDAFEASPGNLAELEAAIAAEKNPENRALLQAELETQRTAAARGGVREAVKLEPDAEAAARVRQTAAAIDEMRLTPDGDLLGAQAHLDALTLAHDQIAAGERVDVSSVMEGRAVDEQRAEAYRTAREAPIETAVPLAPVEGARPPETYFTGSPQRDMTVTRSLGEQSVRGNAEGQFAGPGHYTTTSRDLAGTYGGPEGRLYEVAQPFERAFDFNAVDPVTRQSGKKTYDALVKETGSKAAANRALERQGYDAITFTSPRGEKIANLFRERGLTDIGEARPKSAKPTQELSLAPLGDGNTGRMPDGDRPGAKEEVRTKASDETSAQALDRATTEVVTLNPDMLVQLDGMEAPMRVGEMLERIKKEAKEDAQFGDLVEAAANCFLRN